MVDLDALSREVAAAGDDPVRLALAALKANPPSPDSPLPWKGEGPRVIGHNGITVCYADDKDAAHIAAAVNSAPILAAEVKRLQELLPHAGECAALADLHILCADAGIAPGHIVERVRQLVTERAKARVAVEKSRMFVECFIVPSDGLYDAISTFKVEIPADGYERQWACDAAPAVLAEIDGVLARRAVGLEESHG